MGILIMVTKKSGARSGDVLILAAIQMFFFVFFHLAQITLKVERKLSTSMVEGVVSPTAGAPAAVAGRAGSACYGCASACVEHCLTLLKGGLR